MSKPTTADLNKRITELEAQLADEQGKTATLTTANAELENALQLAMADNKTLMEEKRGTPEGFVLLPIEPDEEIMLAGSDDQDSPWDAETTGRQIRRRILAAVTEVLLKRQ
ncbi:hypothetical protein UXN85_20810 [Enterobacter hormaechei]